MRDKIKGRNERQNRDGMRVKIKGQNERQNKGTE